MYFVPDFFQDEIKVGQVIEVPIREAIELAIVLKINVET
jgi:hypothetical protein